MRCLALVAAAVLAFAVPLTAQVPVTIVQIAEPQVLRAGDGVALVVSVTNLAPRAIVATKVAFTFRRLDGSRGSAIVNQDAYLVVNGQPLPLTGQQREPAPTVIAPGGTASFRSRPQQHVDPDTVGASLQYVVFDDASWEGDARAVEAAFDLRASEALAWRHVASVLETARRGGDARHALDVARASLTIEAPGDVETAQAVRVTIKQALDDSRQPLDAEGLVQRLIEIATLNAAAGDRPMPAVRSPQSRP